MDTLTVVDSFAVPAGLPSLVRAVVIALLGFPLIFVISRGLGTWVTRRYSAQQGMVARKLFLYTGVGLLVVMLLGEMGFSLAPLLGAAGIVGVALGFASQTSVSNIISGFFLMAEQPFRVDDVIRVGQTVGRVLSIDMMSVKLRTFTNEFVRIPNESIIKTEVVNVTRFPIRRLDIPVGVAYKEDVERVRGLLLEVADGNPLALMEPEPIIRFEQFGTSSIDLVLAVWTTRENWLELKIKIQEEIKARFDEEEIEIPFPHQTLYAGLASEPFPVRVVVDRENGEDTEGEPETRVSAGTVPPSGAEEESPGD